MTGEQIGIGVGVTSVLMNIGTLIWASSRLSATLGAKLDNAVVVLNRVITIVDKHSEELSVIRADVAVVNSQIRRIDEGGCMVARSVHKDPGHERL